MQVTGITLPWAHWRSPASPSSGVLRRTQSSRSQPAHGRRFMYALATGGALTAFYMGRMCVPHVLRPCADRRGRARPRVAAGDDLPLMLLAVGAPAQAPWTSTNGLVSRLRPAGPRGWCRRARRGGRATRPSSPSRVLGRPRLARRLSSSTHPEHRLARRSASVCSRLQRVLEHGWYVDNYYSALLVTPGQGRRRLDRLRVRHPGHRRRGQRIGASVRGLAARVGGEVADGPGYARTPSAFLGGRHRSPRLCRVPVVTATVFSIVNVPAARRRGRPAWSAGLLSNNAARAAAMLTAVVTFIVSLAVLGRFDRADAGFQMVEQATWVKSIGLQYLVGLDGISLWMVLLTTFLMPLAVLASWPVEHKRSPLHDRDARPRDRRPWAPSSRSICCCSSCSSKRSWSRCTSSSAAGAESGHYAAVKFFLFTMAGIGVPVGL